MPDAAWWQTAVVYQIYPRSFKDANGDGVGDLQGIIDRLDYLQELGVGALWISPFFKSPMKDYGYDVADYCDVDPLFGTLADFDRLVAGVHMRGMKLLIDWVPNHTSDEHPWFVESRSSKDNPKRDWYIWKDAQPDGSLPNNWGASFGGTTWEYDDTTEQYYFHQFLAGQPDLNWRNPSVRAAMHDVLRFWLTRGVDGFRMDVVHMIWKHPDMPDQPLDPQATTRGAADIHSTQQHLYDWDYEGIHTLMREFRVLLDEFGDKLMIGEIWLPIERWQMYFGSADAPEFQLPFNFRLMNTRWTSADLRREVQLMEEHVPAHGFPNYVLNNHDFARFTSRVSVGQGRVSGMLLLTLRGTPTIYQGEELGMVNGIIAPDEVQDPQGVNLGVAYTRDVTRTPMQWDDSAYAGFGEAKPWLPVHPDYKTVNVLHELQDRYSVLQLYKTLIDWRTAHPALTIGSYRALEAPDGIFAYQRELDGEAFVIVLNLTSKPVNVPLPMRGEIVIDTGLKRQSEPVPGTLELWGDEGVVIKITL